MIVHVRVTPNAKNPELRAIDPQNLEVKVDAKPDKGVANKRMIELLSDYYRVPKSSISIVKGLKSKDKIVIVRIE